MLALAALANRRRRWSGREEDDVFLDVDDTRALRLGSRTRSTAHAICGSDDAKLMQSTSAVAFGDERFARARDGQRPGI
jgi:hypothetical protein|tara:strand:- start:305 stop:541 length:237 start_codon:yes stop_codon:yes gene_type:complete